VVKSLPGVFLLKPDGSSASESWEGRWLVDPSAPEAHAYLAGLFATLTAVQGAWIDARLAGLAAR